MVPRRTINTGSIAARTSLSVAMRQEIYLADEKSFANVPGWSFRRRPNDGWHLQRCFVDQIEPIASKASLLHLARSSLLYREPASKRFTLRAVKSPRSFKMRTSSLLSRNPTKMPSSHRSSTLLATSSSLVHDRARLQRMEASHAAPLVPCASMKTVRPLGPRTQRESIDP